jgi:putative membrane protein
MGTWGWGGWLVSTAMMLIVIGGLAAVIVVALRRGADAGPYDPERILAERFARGDIDEDEYQSRRRALHR